MKTTENELNNLIEFINDNAGADVINNAMPMNKKIKSTAYWYNNAKIISNDIKAFMPDWLKDIAQKVIKENIKKIT